MNDETFNNFNSLVPVLIIMKETMYMYMPSNNVLLKGDIGHNIDGICKITHILFLVDNPGKWNQITSEQQRYLDVVFINRSK